MKKIQLFGTCFALLLMLSSYAPRVQRDTKTSFALAFYHCNDNSNKWSASSWNLMTAPQPPDSHNGSNSSDVCYISYDPAVYTLADALQEIYNYTGGSLTFQPNRFTVNGIVVRKTYYA